LRRDPNYRPAHKALAEHYERVGKKDLAEKHRLAAARSEPARANKPEETLRAAREARRAGRYDEAARHLESFRALGGAREVARLEKALMQAQQGEVASVEKYLRGLLEKKDRPDASLILEALTRGYLENLQFVEAQATLKEWPETKPAGAQGFYLRGRALAELPSGVDNWGRRVVPPEAIKDYHRALEVDPRHEAAGLALAEALLDTGKVEEAQALFRNLLRQSPDSPGGLLGLSRCLRGVGKLAEAQALLDKLLEKHPRHVDGLTERAQLDLDSGKVDSAVALVLKALKLRPHDRQANYTLTLCLRRLGRQQEAEQATTRFKQLEETSKRLLELEKVVLKKPNDPVPRCEAGQVMMRLGEEREGLRWLMSAVRVDPRHRPAHKVLAEYYERIGKKDLAEKHHRLARD
jgi:tetratricopeptide (TPR) repeat protein